MQTTQAIELLKRLIATPSVSREEAAVADIIESELKALGFVPQRKMNNVWAMALDYEAQKPTILLDAHLDTVKPNAQWTRDPFQPEVEDGKLYGLGSNDTGGSLVALLAAFVRLSKSEQPYNLIFLASAEEEVTGVNGVRAVLPELGKIELAIVGEPTSMQPAVAEKGLMVLDCTAYGVAGHAAREEGGKAIYKALKDILRTPRIARSVKGLGIESRAIICALRSHYGIIRIYLFHDSYVTGLTGATPTNYCPQLWGLPSLISVLRIAKPLSCVIRRELTSRSSQYFAESAPSEPHAIRQHRRSSAYRNTLIITSVPGRYPEFVGRAWSRQSWSKHYITYVVKNSGVRSCSISLTLDIGLMSHSANSSHHLSQDMSESWGFVAYIPILALNPALTSISR